MRRVVVTGLGIVSSIGTGQDEVAASLRDARSGVVAAPDHIKYGFRSQVWAPPALGVTAEDWAPHVDRRAARFLANGRWTNARTAGARFACAVCAAGSARRRCSAPRSGRCAAPRGRPGGAARVRTHLAQ